MQLSAPWRTRLACSSSPLVALLTISPHGADPAAAQHLATLPGSIRVATAPDVHVTNSVTGVTYPFWQRLLKFPPITQRLVIEDRRAEIPELTVGLASSSEIATALNAYSGIGATARLDLWMPGLTLSEVLPLMAGPCHPASGVTTETTLTLRLADGDPDHDVTFPPNAIGAGDFPNAPASSLGLVPNWVFGTSTEQMVCPPIDEDDNGQSSHFLVALPALTILPSACQVNGLTLTSDWSVRNTTSVSGLTYTELLLTTPVDPDAEVSVSGGAGITTTHPITYLLQWAGVEPTPATAALLALFSPMDWQGLVNLSGGALSLIRQQYVPQTRWASTFRRGRFALIDLAATAPVLTLSLGSGLLYRLTDQPEATDESRVFNRFVVACGRDHYASSSSETAALLRIVRDRDHGPTWARDLCARSESLYGPRPMPAEVPAYDLAVQFDANGDPVRSAAGEALADLLVRIHALRHRRHTYAVDRLLGLRLNIGDPARLTDPNESLSAVDGRIIEWTPQPSEVFVTVQEDA
jgi:hypothetical protein